MAPKKKAEATEETGALAAEAVAETEKGEAPKAEKAAKGAFVVLDSNGKKFREVSDAEEAKALAAHIGGRVK